MRILLVILFCISLTSSSAVSAYHLVQDWCRCSELYILPDSDNYNKTYRFLIIKKDRVSYVRVTNLKFEIIKTYLR